MNEITATLEDPSASDWLKRAIGDLLRRDMVDATNDAEFLARLMRVRLDKAQGRTSAGHAQCIKCQEVKPVCCDDGYRDLPDGTTEHDDPYCADCCPGRDHHKVNRFPAAGFGTYERTDTEH